jgi:hypothetical protein
VAKPNYAFEKRQRELAKKKKKEEKRDRKHVPGGGPDDASPEAGADASGQVQEGAEPAAGEGTSQS